MASTGLVIAGTGANNADAGSDAWANPDRVTADDASYSSAGSLSFGGYTTQYLHATNFNFSAIPAGSVIVGIVARVQRKHTVVGNSPVTVDQEVYLIKAGTRVGDN